MLITTENLREDGWRITYADTNHAGKFQRASKRVRENLNLYVTLREEEPAKVGMSTTGYYVDLPRVRSMEELSMLVNLLGDQERNK